MFIKKLGRRFNKNDIEVIAENRETCIRFNVKINVKLTEVKYKYGKEVFRNIQHRFIGSCRFKASSLDKLVSNLHGTSGIQCDKCKGNMGLINISGDYTASFRIEKCKKKKKTKGLEDGVLKKNLNHTSRFWRYNNKFCLMFQKGVYTYIYMDGWKIFEETSLPPKDEFYRRRNSHEHAQIVWNTIENKTLGCYHDTYLKANVLLLADIFEAFRDTC